LLDRRANNHQFRGRDASLEISRCRIDRPSALGDTQAPRTATNTDHALCQTALAQGQADRAANQADSDDRHRVPLLHEPLAAAKRRFVTAPTAIVSENTPSTGRRDEEKLTPAFI
jgi:hypothetical protein